MAWFISAYITSRIYRQKGIRDMTDLKIESSLYSEIIISIDDYRIDTWFDRETEKNTQM